MLTFEQNERLSHVGPGTPAGELLRRYWYPVAMAQDLHEGAPTKFVRLLGEDLVLFMDKIGGVGLLADHCAHRGASLLYGRVEERGISCAYHGWLYDAKGNCLETPAEPAESLFHLTVKQRAYPVQKLAGLYWAYLGPAPAPVLPLYDVLARTDGRRTLQLRAQVDCNYLQAMENSADPAHASLLHQEFHAAGRTLNATRGTFGEVASFDFVMTDYGFMKRRIYRDGRAEQHPLIFPHILRQGNGMEIRVPLDDGHTWIWEVRFSPAAEGDVMSEEPTVVPAEPHKEPMHQMHPFTRHRMDRIDAQDYMAWETQGAIPDRSIERLGTSDKGVVLLRDLYLENIDRVERGEDPLAVVRDPERGLIDTGLSGTFAFERSRQENPVFSDAI